MKIVIKVGTQSILSEQGVPLESVFNSLVEQIVRLKSSGHRIVLVSSGAVCLGRRSAKQILHREYGNSVGEKQLLASLGQHELMNLYSSLFEKYGIAVAQLLLTKQDFETRKKYLNIQRIWEELLANSGIIPIVNENDSVAIEELMFTDNDELSGLIAVQIGADKLIILSNVEGVYSGSPTTMGSELIPIIDPKIEWPNVSLAKSTQGRGGMFSKLNTARRASELGITTHIACANHPLVIEKIMTGEQIGTVVIPSSKKSSFKRWIAYNESYSHASIVINDILLDILRNKKEIVSILPIGIENCIGEFQKGDIIRIVSRTNENIGVGIAKYDDKKLRELIGHKNQPEFIHCDYLHVF
jgi:glutamate 5-kinase